MGAVGPLVVNTSAGKWLAERNGKTDRACRKELNWLHTKRQSSKEVEVLRKEGSFKQASAGQRGCLERK